MPSLGGATGWLNSEPLGPAELRGHVVLVDFWTLRPVARGRVHDAGLRETVVRYAPCPASEPDRRGSTHVRTRKRNQPIRISGV
jgi:hypothetical protein